MEAIVIPNHVAQAEGRSGEESPKRQELTILRRKLLFLFYLHLPN